MRILFLTQVLPFPLDAGPKIRAYYVLRYLCQHHEVTLASFVRPTDTAEAIAHLQQFCRDVHTVAMPRSKLLDVVHMLKSLVTTQPFIIARDWMPTMVHLLQDLIARTHFDAIHADQLWMAPYALWARQAVERREETGERRQERGNAQMRPLTVLDQHNAVYLIPKRLAEHERNPLKRALLALEARKLARFEMGACRQFDRVAWVSNEDYAALQRRLPNNAAPVPKTAMIPICVNPQDEPAIVRQSAGRRVTFLGGLHWPPNAEGIQWFVQEVWPQVHAQAPDAILTVIGKHPPAALQEGAVPNLQITGYVDDPAPFLAETAAFIVPLHAGGGMRVKILDAWAWGLPIVSTTTGAEGIDICPGENILIADSATEFAQALIHLLKDSAQATVIAQAGRAWVERRYNWRIIYPAWDRIYSWQTITASAISE
ncbi:MAG: glycosyltransferase family 4 protein [Caldilineaceae bacterium]